MTDQELKDLVAGLAISQAKTDAQIAATEAQMARTDAQIAETNVKLAEVTRKLEKIGVLAGNISNNQGDVAEEFFYNSLAEKQTLGGIHYDRIDKNVMSSTGKIRDEFDIVMVNGKDVALIEVKYKAHDKDLHKLLTKKVHNFRLLYPHYANYALHLGLASFSMSEDLKNEALDNGVMVLQRKGDIMETLLPDCA